VSWSLGELRPRLAGIAAGMHAVLDLPDESAVIARAADHGLAVQGLRGFAAVPGDRAGLVIGYGRPPEHAYSTALARLAAVLSSLSSSWS
jgi:GntR family transcriptional regulator / MocR family aminotransferase